MHINNAEVLEILQARVKRLQIADDPRHVIQTVDEIVDVLSEVRSRGIQRLNATTPPLPTSVQLTTGQGAGSVIEEVDVWTANDPNVSVQVNFDSPTTLSPKPFTHGYAVDLYEKLLLVFGGEKEKTCRAMIDLGYDREHVLQVSLDFDRCREDQSAKSEALKSSQMKADRRVGLEERRSIEEDVMVDNRHGPTDRRTYRRGNDYAAERLEAREPTEDE